MSNTSEFESSTAKLNKKIELQVDKIVAASPLKLPASDAEICKLYVNKIEGQYNVERAKKDTDNAVDLLYIAYNTTPQEAGEIRAAISGIMDKLIQAQQQSELAMRKAMGLADNVIGDLKRTFIDWPDVKGECKGPEDTEGVAEIKDFIKKDILELAKKIKAKALDVKRELDVIAVTYDAIIKETAAATAKSETALAIRLDRKAAIEKEIVETNARREQLEELVKDLQSEVSKYDKMARDYESRANTAEERAFIMSIVQIGAQMLSAAIPAIVTAATAAATGGASTIASAAASTVNRAVGDKNGDVKSDTATDAQVIETKTKISEKKAKVITSEAKITELKEKLTGLEKDLAVEEKKDDKNKDTVNEEKDKGKVAQEKEDTAVVKGIKSRIDDTKKELTAEEANYQALIGALSGLQDSLIALDKGLGKLTEKQENSAASLREMQMKMLDKVEAYEKERRTQNADLVKINALLKGSRSREETIHLAIQSLNISLSALKRSKEIIEEIAFFFKSFADFMDRVSQEIQLDIELFDDLGSRDKLRKNAFQELVLGADKFFVRQAAEWHAIKFVSDKFCMSFADGWSKLNKLSGTYIMGNELETYLKAAAPKLEEIVAERQAASNQKILDLDGYRKQLRDSAMAS